MSRSGLRAVGPAIIVASVVLGPGSILISSRIGCDHGYQLLWLVVLSVVLMIGMTALAARVGTGLPHSPCEELARRGGRPLAAAVGLVLFLVVACFQFSNNIAVIAAVEPYVGGGGSGSGSGGGGSGGGGGGGGGGGSGGGGAWRLFVLAGLNLAILGALFSARRLYQVIETSMKILVGVMILGFLGNLAFAQPSLTAILSGLLPSLPAGMGSSLLPARVGSDIVDPLLPVQALVGTTFSVAGAFYQAYLVRDKGWTGDDLRRGLFDSVVGISVLGCLTLTVMVTAAAVLHGKVRGSDLKSAADVALQLEPLFGGAAKLLFSVGLLAGALSSFLVNAMIGGAVLSDGLGFGGQMDRRGPKLCTAIALLVGMAVAMAMQASEWSPLQLVYFAQAMTVVGNPVLALVLLWLSRAAGTPRWIQVVAGLGLLLVLFLAVRTGLTLYFKCFGAG